MSIGEYVSQKDEIERLNKQITMIASFYNEFYSNLYKDRISELTRQRNQSNKNKHAMKVKAENATSKAERKHYNNKIAKALKDLKKKGVLDMHHKQIADYCFLSVHTVNAL